MRKSQEGRALRQFTLSTGKSAGRNSSGRITVFHRGGGSKRLQRRIDLKRSTSSMGIVERIEYDPNRSSRIVVLFLFFVFTVYFLSLVLGFDSSLLGEKLKSMLLWRSLRLLFSRLLGWEVPFFFLCIVGSVVGSCFQGSESASAAAAPYEPSEIPGGSGSTAQQPPVVPSGGSSAGVWTRFEEDALLESSSGQSSSNPSVNQPQPGEQAMPPANPVASGEAEAGPSHVLPFPYDEEEVIGGDSVLSIQSRLLAKYDFPSAEQIECARIEAQKRFEIKVEIIRLMTPRDPEGDWEGRGARALDNPRTKTGEESYARLSQIRDSLSNEGIQSRFFADLKERVFLRKDNFDDESQA